ncbi:MAG: biopolymer transporter ExbD [Spirochaetes bacterium]|nr:biopolymer transporter ExbD [Spirochaetota bacterium]
MKKKSKYKINVIVPFVTMADIAFLLLIFLIVTSSVQKRPDIRLSLPESAQFDKIEKKKITEITVDKRNVITFEKREYSLPALKKALIPLKKCIISADKEADFRIIYEIMEVLKKKGFETVSFDVIRRATI